MDTRHLWLVSLFSILFFSSLTLAQSGDYASSLSIVISGGGSATKPGVDEYDLTMAVGQPLAGTVSGNGYVLSTGFWRPAENTQDRVLAIYALGLDNRTSSPGNLSAYYASTIRAIMNATRGQPKKIAVILADRDEWNDTRILVIRNGRHRFIPASQWPAELRQPPEYPEEFDMTDGERIGHFIRWARDNYAASKTYFAYVAHGLPLSPDTDISKIFTDTLPAQAASIDVSGLPTVPTHKYQHPDFSDFRPELALISPHELALALQIGSKNGKDPLTVVDVTHCFAASIEEFYELSKPRDTEFYAHALIGSPNYAYFAPELVGSALGAAEPTQTYQEMATDILNAYDNVFKAADGQNGTGHAVDHPRLIIAVESSKVEPIKTAVDELADGLVRNFDRQKILNAYRDSAKYDTSYCYPQDWMLEANSERPDALSDLADFAAKLAVEYAGAPEIVEKAQAVARSIVEDKAVFHSIRADGYPWFADVQLEGDEPWKFPGAGLSIYTDFVGQKKDGVSYLSWHADWYTTTVSADNPNPFEFLRSETNHVTWNDVFHLFWPEGSFESQACLPIFPPLLRRGELSVKDIVFPAEREVEFVLSEDSPTRISAAIGTGTVAEAALISFTVTYNGPNQQIAGKTVFSDTVNASYMVTGTHMIEATKLFTPADPGNYTLHVIVDPDNRFQECDDPLPPENCDPVKSQRDNEMQRTYTVPGFFERPTITATADDQIIRSDITNISVQKDDETDAIKEAEVQVYQYVVRDQQVLTATQLITVRVPLSIPTRDTSIHTIPITLTDLQPGPVEVHVWGINSGNLTAGPGIAKFNYAPLNTPINQNERHYFLYEANKNDLLEFKVDTIGNEEAKQYGWVEESFWEEDYRRTSPAANIMAITPVPYTGTYLIAVQGSAVSTYTLSVKHAPGSGIEMRAAAYTNEMFAFDDLVEPQSRPIFIPVIPDPPFIPPPIPPIYMPVVVNRYAPPLPDLVVADLVATSNDIQVTIHNQGELTVTHGFWVDAYIDPFPIPSRSNQIWPELSYQGLVWGVTDTALPLPPGSSITLRLNDAYYHADLSVFTPTLPARTPVYVQVDSANKDTTFGAILESHERDGGEYNNIYGPILSTADASLDNPTTNVQSAVNNSNTDNLPERPHAEKTSISETESQSPDQESQNKGAKSIWLPLINNLIHAPNE
ncbi:MAG: hypothetical protein R3A44_10145 [Caldilineaceae bacterium]